jgi:hypothetical protein
MDIRLRRNLFVLLVWAVLAAPAGAAEKSAASAVGKTGLPTQPWFRESSLDLRRDLAGTVKIGRLLAVVWE